MSVGQSNVASGIRGILIGSLVSALLWAGLAAIAIYWIDALLAKPVAALLA